MSVQNGQDRKSNIFRRNVSVDTNTHRTIEELNGAVLPIQSAEKLYKECRNVQRCSGHQTNTTFAQQRVLETDPKDRLGSRGTG
jgi:hypothetical protein